jgi:hypothetical protein
MGPPGQVEEGSAVAIDQVKKAADPAGMRNRTVKQAWVRRRKVNGRSPAPRALIH